MRVRCATTVAAVVCLAAAALWAVGPRVEQRSSLVLPPEPCTTAETKPQAASRSVLLVYASTFYGKFVTMRRQVQCPAHEPGMRLEVTLEPDIRRASDADGLIYLASDMAREAPCHSLERRFGSDRNAGEFYVSRLV